MERGIAVATTQWSSRSAFLLASIGSAVGLGNLWRFPFYTGENGGAAFVAVYLICVAVIGYPVLMGELAVGRHKGLSAVGSTRQLALDSGASGRWSVVGWIGVLTSFLILTTYSVIAGQIMAFSAGQFSQSLGVAGAEAGMWYAGSGQAVLWHTVFLLASATVVSAGLHGGIERAVTVLMPMFFVMLLGLCIYALSTGAAAESIEYLFAPDFSALTPGVILAALSQACFSLGVGGALLMTYGSFLPQDENIGRNAGVIASSDTLVAMVAGLMIFPIVFANSLDPAVGAQLIFDALPTIFAGMPGGSFVGGLFFFLAFVAALTTVLSILIAASLVGEDLLGWSRRVSTFVAAGCAWAIGAASIGVSGLAGPLDFLSGSVLLPTSVLLVALFVGWIAPPRIMRGELRNTSDGLFDFWHVAIRYLVPVAILAILVFGIDAYFGFGLSAMLE
jgi:NSS family neurotransmitter:Na+ symporter